ncbi:MULTISPECIES: hypothetical protein [Deefgea]|uniref:Uncharacterized protein n=1 Tax=Deefgea chitinilytica TaxID=570276 RepID=A0ABS2CDK8_9NEIS|nr:MULTISPECIES: hypothetical protein [Deefgea]MBM5572210.1 hypothetical protein [Deefgea chitinilytica]MBM9889445.1 hypothetical protein [Deefgea sp. CFH1-16]
MQIKYSQFLAALCFSAVAWNVSAANVGVSIQLGDPDFYGRIDMGQRYQPQVIYERPIVIHQSRYSYPPLYLRVPPGHTKHWSRHCSAYGACDRPVYFVKDSWYREAYRDRYYRNEHRRGHGHSKHWRDD